MSLNLNYNKNAIMTYCYNILLDNFDQYIRKENIKYNSIKIGFLLANDINFDTKQ